MPLALLQESVQYDKSIKWQIHRNYFLQRGALAWKKVEVPYYITCNTAAALQRVKMVLAAVEQMEKDGAMSSDEPIVVLEMGSGGGMFAFNFIRMVKHMDVEQGTHYAKRLRYIFSDFSAKTVSDATISPKLRPFVEEGILTFGVVDALNPQAGAGLDGKPLSLNSAKIDKKAKKEGGEDNSSLLLNQLTAVITNYMQDNLSLTVLRKTSLGWREKYIGLRLEVPEGEDEKEFLRRAVEEPVGINVWDILKEDEEYLPLREGTIRNPMHMKVMDEMAKDMEKVTLPYAYGSIQNIEQTMPMLRDGGIMLHTDKGNATVSEWEGVRSCDPSLHGNSLAHMVNFPFIRGVIQKLGFAAMQTEDPNFSVQTILIEKRPASALEKTFKTLYINENLNRDLTDYNTASDVLMKEDSHKDIALRFLYKALSAAPGDSSVLNNLATQCLLAGRYEESMALYAQCEAVDFFGTYDCPFGQGRALYKLERYQEAIEAYARSIDIADHQATRYNTGLCYEMLKQPEKAKECYEKALEIQSDYEPAKECLAKLNAS